MASYYCPEVVFSFGPKGAFFLEYNGESKWYNIPTTLLELVQTNRPGAQVSRTISIALGEKNSWVIVYENAAGEIMCEMDKLPKKLSNFLLNDDLEIDYTTLNISLGTEGKFFASAKNNNDESFYCYDKLTGHCAVKVKEEVVGSDVQNELWRMTLGVGKEFIMYQVSEDAEDGGWSCVLNPKGILDKEDKIFNGDLDQREYLFVLNPFTPEKYLIIRPDNTVRWSVHSGFDDEIFKLAMELLKKVDPAVDATDLIDRVKGDTHPNEIEPKKNKMVLDNLFVLNPFTSDKYLIIRPDNTVRWSVHSGFDDEIFKLAMELLKKVDPAVDATDLIDRVKGDTHPNEIKPKKNKMVLDNGFEVAMEAGDDDDTDDEGSMMELLGWM